MPVKGINKAKSNYKDLVRRVSEVNNPKVMQQVLTIGATEAALRTPVDTSTLINSQFKKLFESGGKLIGQVGYTANYAFYVHSATEKLKSKPRAKRNGQPQGNYWDPNGESQFLKKGFEVYGADAIRTTIINGLKL